MNYTLEDLIKKYRSTFIEYIHNPRKDWCATVPTFEVEDDKLLKYKAYVVLVEGNKSYCVSVCFDLDENPDPVYECFFKSKNKMVKKKVNKERENLALAFLIEGMNARIEEYKNNLGDQEPKGDYLDGLIALEKYFASKQRAEKCFSADNTSQRKKLSLY